jgi:TolB-like protein/class 3 adenylate cyclase/Flp pilus assembly protein TadD
MIEIRKLAAIMVIDVVGYSRLMGEDEAGTVRTVREHRDAARPTIAGRGGRIVKTMGDGLLLEFPSVVDAVECAIAIQELMVERNAEMPENSRIVYRIGVNLGDVLVEGEDILGEGVNIAARLESICEPGGVLISSTAFDHVRGRTDAYFVDLGEKDLKNISRPVRVFAITTGVISPAPLAAAWKTSGPHRLSIIVLPFVNLSDDSAQDYFADGITGDITTDLSRIPDSFVIARNTAFTFKGKNVDAKQVGRELGIRYVLEGSVRRSGTRVRTNAQLIDARNGAHLWAERFDCDRSDLMDVQDEITGRIASALGVQLIDAESKRALREHPTSPDAIDLTMQGWASLGRPPTPDSLAGARALFERAITLDSKTVSALVGLAYGLARAVNSGFSGSLDAHLAEAHSLVGEALALAPENARALWVLGLILRSERKLEQAVAAFEAAIAVDRNFAPAFGSLGDVVTFLGRPDETIRYNHQALRLSPRDPLLANWQFDIGLAHFLLGSMDDAVVALLRARNNNPELPFAGVVLAAAYAMLGSLDLAHIELTRARETAPWATSITRIREAVPVLDSPKASDMIDKSVFMGLRLAGLPD